MVQDVELARDLLDDVNEVIGELGSVVKLIKITQTETEDPTSNDTITEEYETMGVVFKSKDFVRGGVSVNGERNILLDLKQLGDVIPQAKDSVIDSNGIKYKIEDVEIYTIAGINVAAELKAVM